MSLLTSKIPLKMNTVSCTIRPLTVNSNLIDEVWRSQVPKTYDNTGGSDFTIDAQVFWRRREEEKVTMSGDLDNTTARLVARKYDIDQLSVAPKKGDLVVSIAGKAFDVNSMPKITEVRYKGHLNGVPNLIWYEFIEDEYSRKSS